MSEWTKGVRPASTRYPPRGPKIQEVTKIGFPDQVRGMVVRKGKREREFVRLSAATWLVNSDTETGIWHSLGPTKTAEIEQLFQDHWEGD